MKSVAAVPLAVAAPTSSKCGDVPPAQAGSRHKLVGEALPAWKPGEFQVHFIYTGVCESMFWIMPDGTTMLLDCGDFRAWARGKKAVWILPDGWRHPGEWIARYVERVNPAKTSVDYLMLSHHHSDHGGSDTWGAGMRVWTACVWDQLHMTADTLEHLSDRTAYPDPRLIAPGVFSPLRRFEDAGRDYLRDIAPESFDAGHVVLNVAPGGRTYSIIYVMADDESMRVTGAYDFA